MFVVVAPLHFVLRVHHGSATSQERHRAAAAERRRRTRRRRLLSSPAACEERLECVLEECHKRCLDVAEVQGELEAPVDLHADDDHDDTRAYGRRRGRELSANGHLVDAQDLDAVHPLEKLGEGDEVVVVHEVLHADDVGDGEGDPDQVVGRRLHQRLDAVHHQLRGDEDEAEDPDDHLDDGFNDLDDDSPEDADEFLAKGATHALERSLQGFGRVHESLAVQGNLRVHLQRLPRARLRLVGGRGGAQSLVVCVFVFLAPLAT
mmetsp:Transcript_35643/g.87686  ORF Transcript_35643/g.87686 Transcript_35643/m.87686 type:complete len:263 (+) Transcript_35643:471-1259(+)